MKKVLLVIISFLFILPLSDMEAQRRGKRTVKSQIPLDGTVFYIRNVKAKKYLDVSGTENSSKARSNGTNVQLWTLDGGADQKYKFVSAGNGYYHIQTQHARMNLDVHGCFDGKMFCGTYKKDKGANVQVWSAGRSEPQQWRLEEVSPGRFYIKNRYSGKYLDASDSNINKNGCNVQQWNKDSNTNKQWELVDVKTGMKYQESSSNNNSNNSSSNKTKNENSADEAKERLRNLFGF